MLQDRGAFHCNEDILKVPQVMVPTGPTRGLCSGGRDASERSALPTGFVPSKLSCCVPNNTQPSNPPDEVLSPVAFSHPRSEFRSG